MKKFLLVLLCVALVFCFAGCKPEEEPDTTTDTTTDDWAYIQDKGELVVGITIFEPMNYYDENGELTGFETEFTQAVCEKLGITPIFEEINWNTKEIELAAKSIDCIWNGLTVSEERRLNMDFSQSYIKNWQVMVIRTADADLYTDVASTADARFVAETESAGHNYIADEEALADADYTAVATQTGALLEVKANTADIAVIDYVMALATVGNADFADLMILESAGQLGVEEYAIGFRLGSTAVSLFDQAIDELVADGTLQALAAKYGLSEQLIFNQD